MRWGIHQTPFESNSVQGWPFWLFLCILRHQRNSKQLNSDILLITFCFGLFIFQFVPWFIKHIWILYISDRWRFDVQKLLLWFLKDVTGSRGSKSQWRGSPPCDGPSPTSQSSAPPVQADLTDKIRCYIKESAQVSNKTIWRIKIGCHHGRNKGTFEGIYFGMLACLRLGKCWLSASCFHLQTSGRPRIFIAGIDTFALESPRCM